MKNYFRVISFILLGVLAPYISYAIFEGSLTSAATASDEVLVSLTVAATISVSSPSDVNLGTITGTGSAIATSTWSVITNNTSGYRVDIKAADDPSMLCISGGCNVGVDNIADYTPAAVDVPETWSVVASDAEFGITVGGTAASSTFSDGGKFYDLTTGYRHIGGEAAQTAGTNVPVGYKVEIGASKVQPTGNYRSTVTLQVTTL